MLLFDVSLITLRSRGSESRIEVGVELQLYPKTWANLPPKADSPLAEKIRPCIWRET
jgi:hypothetical protein